MNNCRDDKGKFSGGNKGGPGRPRKVAQLPQDLKDVQIFTKSEWTRVFCRFFYMTVEDLEKLIASKDQLRVHDALVARIVLEALKGGDEKKLAFMLDRTIGRVTDRVEISAPKPYIIRRRDGSVEEMGARVLTPEEIERKADAIRKTTTGIKFVRGSSDFDPYSEDSG